MFAGESGSKAYETQRGAPAPTYVFSNDFTEFRDFFLDEPHRVRMLAPGEALHAPGHDTDRVYFIEDGLLRTRLAEETGQRKFLCFVGANTIHPSGHVTAHGMERFLETTAISQVKALEFQRGQYRQMLDDCSELCLAQIANFAKYLNLFAREAGARECDNAFAKTCNVLYLLFTDPHLRESMLSVGTGITPKSIADLVGADRDTVSRHLARLRGKGIIAARHDQILLLDKKRLVSHCTA